MADTVDRAQAFLKGERLTFDQADCLWRTLASMDELSLARSVLSRLRRHDCLLGPRPAARRNKEELCRQEAMLTSKDAELSAAIRHDQALTILSEEFDLDAKSLDGDSETLGIAGGICKRRWNDLGQMEDLRHAATYYERGAGNDFGEDAYAHINAAFLQDVLAQMGDDPAIRRLRARELRERICENLRVTSSWWNSAARAEALFGLGRYAEASEAIAQCTEKPEAWKLQATARQLAHLAHLCGESAFDQPEIRKFFDILLPGAADAVRSASLGKVGLALSGGGFRASFFHLGVLARLAELNALRHVEVLSCVSGGSVIGACYWLALRRRLLDTRPSHRDDYIRLVADLIDHFQSAVATDLRAQAQPSKVNLVWRLVQGEKGAMDPEQIAPALAKHFFRPLFPGTGPLYMHDLPFEPADHSTSLTGSATFHPGKHNWLRAHKVPVLVLNATTVNTGHAWQFTPTWMGESPWAVYETADSIPRLEWSWYQKSVGWQIELARAVAASACVPGVFAPLRIDNMYDGIDVQLVDGGVHDNQGTVSLLALDCNVLMVSDASGQLLLESKPSPGVTGLAGYAKRSMDTLMERIRLANFADLSARRRFGVLHGFMFLHMKAGLDADTKRLRFSQEAYELACAPLTAFGVRKDFQQALAELRTDLDDFTPDESLGLMACGYQMATKAFDPDLGHLKELWQEPTGNQTWTFSQMLKEITSTDVSTPRRSELLATLREGSKIRL